MDFVCIILKMKSSMSKEEKWFHPNKLPLSGYQSNIIQDHNSKSFYPFNSELGYRIFKRIIEMKRTSIEQQNNEEIPNHSKYVNQMNKDKYFSMKQDVCSQKPNSIPSNSAFNQFGSIGNMPEFHLTLKCDIDDMDES
ncbi:hypothetical protein Smp_125190 [Schistosoma mansoni]|uniref:hypothetical protein n=1 Tax=Schistosoma mansoni TaxID=6183 RepID=UPI00022DC698|nr:hypothetical protein Smp_125190 [Schistosoma mansoni]|eukprot:XP_018648772.1 hypothetical protein Smp_125190 [Schistosoma mansoni]